MLNFESEINVITLAYIAQLGFKMWTTNVAAQKIDKFLVETYSMVIAIFHFLNKLSCSWFFWETFLLADIGIKVVLRMLFLTFSNIHV